MNELHPIDTNYEPEYPPRLSLMQIHTLVRPNLMQRFSRQTLLGGAVLAGSAALSGCGSTEAEYRVTSDNPPTAAKPLPTPSDRNVDQRVNEILTEILGGYDEDQRNWNSKTHLGLIRPISANPPIKTPRIPVSFGNSYVGIFDVEKARDATRQLFEAWGIDLKRDVRIKGDGYEFTADGWSEEHQVGFKLVMPEGQVGFIPKKFPKLKDADKLDEDELGPLEKVIEEGRLRLLVVPATEYPNMDGDLYTPTEYYLATVVDYLNWIHGDRRISKNSVLGNLPGAKTQRSYPDNNQPIPGGDFEEADDLKTWTVTRGGQLERTDAWSDFGRWALKLDLSAGGSATCTLMDGETVPVPKERPWFQVGHELSHPQAAKIDLTLIDRDGNTWRHGNILKEDGGYIDNKTRTPPIDELKKLTITNAGEEPVVLLIDDIGFWKRD